MIQDRSSGKIISLLVFLLMIFSSFSWNQLSAQSELPLTYLWKPKYYASVEGQERLIYARSFARSQMKFVDIDGDLDKDLLIGKADGRLAFFRNEGTPKQPRLRLETEDFEVIHEEKDANQQLMYLNRIVDVGKNAAPELSDIDDDGDMDLFVGSSDGQIFFFENRGNKLLPKFFRVTPIYMNLNFVGNSVPRFADLNGDLVQDLVVGLKDGRVMIFFNSGVSTNALFCKEFEPLNPPDKRCKYQPLMLTNISPLGDASPAIVDWDLDKDLDIVIGKSNGKLDFFWNKGNPIEPDWHLESNHFQFIDSGGLSVPTFHDMNGDGYPELFVGTSTSGIIYYENRELVFDRLKAIKTMDLTLLNPTDGPERILKEACEQLRGMPECLFPLGAALDVPPGSKLAELDQLLPYLLRPDTSLNSTPLAQSETAETKGKAKKKPVMQANTNTEKDATAETSSEAPAETTEEESKDKANTTVEASEPEVKEPNQLITRNQLWLNTRNFLGLHRLTASERHAIPFSTDWNKDGKSDLILGSASGRLYAFENRGEKEPDWWPLEQKVFAPNQRRYSAPTLGDLDGDGDLDLISGNRQGRLELMENRGTAEKPEWTLTDVNLAQIDVGSYSVPRLFDIDGDGDLDLFVGNSRGLVIFYENQGSKESSMFVIRSTRFAGVNTKGHAVPAFFEWNADNQNDLLVGSREGFLGLHTNTAAAGTSVMKGWKAQSDRWQDLRVPSFSSPYFTDLNGDEKIDLLMGDEEGHLILLENTGVLKTEEIPESELVLTQNIVEEEPVALEETAAVVVQASQAKRDDSAFDPNFELVTTNYGGLDVGKRAVPAFLDLDGDSDLDLVIGNHAGELRLYLHETGSEDGEWLLETKTYLGYQGGRNASPVFTDLDGDSDRDLLVGTERGKIFYWENQGSLELPDLIPNPTPFIGVTGGRNSVPSVLDLNRDGQMDLLVGNFLGHIREYHQINNGDAPHFKLERRQFLNLDVGLGAVPRVADLNNDSFPDLVIGSDHGRLVNFQPNTEEKAVNAMQWKLKGGYFDKLKLPVGGAPVFEDMDFDGDLDMVIGTENGTLEYYRNIGR